MIESSDKKYYGSKQSDGIPGLRHEGSKLKTKPKIFVNSDTRSSDKYYKNIPTVGINPEEKRVTATSFTVDNNSIDDVIVKVIEQLKIFDRVSVVCPENAIKAVTARLETAVGRLLLTSEQLARISVIESKQVPELVIPEVKQIEPEIKVIEPEIKTVEPVITTVEPSVQAAAKTSFEND